MFVCLLFFKTKYRLIKKKHRSFLWVVSYFSGCPCPLVSWLTCSIYILPPYLDKKHVVTVMPLCNPCLSAEKISGQNALLKQFCLSAHGQFTLIMGAVCMLSAPGEDRPDCPQLLSMECTAIVQVWKEETVYCWCSLPLESTKSTQIWNFHIQSRNIYLHYLEVYITYNIWFS